MVDAVATISLIVKLLRIKYLLIKVTSNEFLNENETIRAQYNFLRQH